MIIKTKSISKEYKNGVVAVNDVSLEFEQGVFYMIKGRSGSGKSTLMHLLGLLDLPTQGEIYIDDRNVSKLRDKALSQIRNVKFGFVFQSYFLNSKLKAYENVMLPMYINKGIDNKKMKSRAYELLEKVGLSKRITHYPAQLSGGEQQRVAIARALANNPDCIFADEPTGNLDSKSELEVLKLLRELADSGKMVVVVSHNDIVEEYADKILLMNDGDLSEVK